MTLGGQGIEFKHQLGNGFELRGLSLDEFKPLWQEHYPLVFREKTNLDIAAVLSDKEKLCIQQLTELMGKPLCFRFGIFKGQQFVGWHIGNQKSGEEFYMRNSGVLSEFQGQGLYTAILPPIVTFLKECGFQVISSKHNATNNRVIIPKLKAGFVITGLEISDKFGTMVRLEYFTNPIRREMVDVRSGQSTPSAALKPFL